MVSKDALNIDTHKIKLVKGSHIVVKKFWEGDNAYLFQNDDKRVIFVNPYEQNKYALIGTTDIVYEGNPNNVSISKEEEQYLCDAINKYTKNKITTDDIVYKFSGIRPLVDDNSDNPSAIIRDYTLELEAHDGAILLQIFGGKLTTYRKLGELVLDKLCPYFDIKDKWTHALPLLGGDIVMGYFDTWLKSIKNLYSFIDEFCLTRMAHQYGTMIYYDV